MVRVECWTNFLWQISHSYGFSPVWIRRCDFKLMAPAKDRPQYSQSDVFLVKCKVLWLLRCEDLAKLSPQKEHLNGRSPVWMRWCVTHAVLKLEANGQNSHRNRVFFSCLSMCKRKLDFREKHFWHLGHSYGSGFGFVLDDFLPWWWDWVFSFLTFVLLK